MDDRPGLAHHLLTAFITLLILEQHSRLPEAAFFPLAIAVPISIGLFAVYCAALYRNQKQQAATANVRSRIHWAFFPLALVLMFSSAATHWPATIRFQLSKHAFEQLVSDAYAGKKPHGFPKRVGLYWIESIYDYDFDYRNGTGTIGFVTGEALIDECGLYFDKSNRQSSHYLTTRISPHWYVTEW